MRKVMPGVAMAVWLAGCGGGGARYKVDDSTIASATMQERQGVLAADSERTTARAEQQKAGSDLKAAENDLDIADNEYKQARLQLDTAQVQKKAADQSGDVNRKAAAQRDLHVADLWVKAADAKRDWMEKKRKQVKAQRDAADDHYAASDARYELEKARLLQAKGIKPSNDFNVYNFEADSLKKQQRYSESRMDADRRQVDVDKLERDWRNLQAAYEQAKSAAR